MPTSASGRHRRDVRAGRAYAVSLAWTGLDPGRRRTRSSRSTGRPTSASSARRRATSRCRRRTSSTPTPTATSATSRRGYPGPGSATPGSPPGYRPSPGWDSQWDWKGFVPFDADARSFDPPEGFLVAANQAVTGRAALPHGRVGLRLPQPADPRPGGPSRRSPRADVPDPGRHVNAFAPTSSGAAQIDHSDFTDEAQALLRDWDCTQPTATPAAAAAAYYNAVWKVLLQATFDDQCPPTCGPTAAAGGGWSSLACSPTRGTRGGTTGGRRRRRESRRDPAPGPGPGPARPHQAGRAQIRTGRGATCTP